MKRLLCVILSGVLALGILSGCGGNETAGNLFNKETLKSSGLDFGGLKMPLTENGDKITWMVTSEVTTLNDSYVVKKLRELTGVDLQLDILSPSSAEEKTIPETVAGEEESTGDTDEIVTETYDKSLHLSNGAPQLDPPGVSTPSVYDK